MCVCVCVCACVRVRVPATAKQMLGLYYAELAAAAGGMQWHAGLAQRSIDERDLGTASRARDAVRDGPFAVLIDSFRDRGTDTDTYWHSCGSKAGYLDTMSKKV